MRERLDISGILYSYFILITENDNYNKHSFKTKITFSKSQDDLLVYRSRSPALRTPPCDLLSSLAPGSTGRKKTCIGTSFRPSRKTEVGLRGQVKVTRPQGKDLDVCLTGSVILGTELEKQSRRTARSKGQVYITDAEDLSESDVMLFLNKRIALCMDNICDKYNI